MNRSSEVLGSPAPGNGHIPGYNPGNSGDFLTFFGLRRNPFNVNPDPRDLFWTPQTLRALSELTSAVESRKSLVVLTGEVGTGKTTLINHLLNSLRERELPVAFVFNSHLGIDNLYDFILADFGIKEDLSRPRNLRKTLQDWLFERRRAGRHPILIIDEAQGLTFEALEEVRMLLNLEVEGEKLIQIVLSGQPELDVTLAKPQLLQLRQRISLRCKTAPLTIAETHDYVHRRLEFGGAQPDRVFATEALDALYFYSGGTPRVINLLCEQALMRAHSTCQLPVSAQIVEEVAREFQFDDFKPFPRSLDFGPRPMAEILPMPTSPTKMRMAAMAARESVAQAEMLRSPAPSATSEPAPRIAPLPPPVPAKSISTLPALDPAPVSAPVSAAHYKAPLPPPAPAKSVSTLPGLDPAPVSAPVSAARYKAPLPLSAPRRYRAIARVAAQLPVMTRLGTAVRPAWKFVQQIIATSSRWLRQPMRPAHARRDGIS